MTRTVYTLAVASWMALGAGFVGCSSNLAIDAGPPEGGANADSSTKGDADVVAIPHVVVVNALDQSLDALKDDDIRICLGTNTTDRPLPDDPTRPMPLTNYAGIPLGGGADLGQRVMPQTIYVISAKAQHQNYPGAGANELSCNELISTNATGVPYLTVAVPPAPIDRVIVLTDDPGDGGAAAAVATIDDTTHAGAADGGTNVFAQFGAYGPWAGDKPTMVDVLDPGDAGSAVASIDGGNLSEPPSVAVDVSSPDQRALRFSSMGASPSELTQSFQSIQLVSDPTTTAADFYGARANFLFLALGNPATGDGGAPAYGGRGLHIVAIPYVP